MTRTPKRPAARRKGGILAGIALAAFVLLAGIIPVVFGLVYWLP